jgi:hypothetical protein
MKNRPFIFVPSLVLAVMVLFSFVSSTEKTFPSLTAENLEGKSITLPADTKGKYSLVGLAYSQKSQEDLKSWLQPIYDTFIAKSDKPVLFDDTYDINLYLVLMFTGSNEGMAAPAKKKMREELDPELKPYVLIYKGDIAKYKETLAMTDKDKPYFFILDEEGKVVHTVSGAYSEAKMEKIETLLDEE